MHLLATLLLILATPGLAQEPAPRPEVGAVVDQEVLPTLEARQRTAAERIRARQAFFSGEGTLAEAFAAAFPHLAGARLWEAAVLEGRLALLDEAGAARAAERVEPVPDVPSAPALVRAREAALDGEDAAAALERRLLLAVRARLEASPDLAALLAEARDHLETTRDQAVAAAAAVEGEARATHRADAARADVDLASLDALERALVVYAAVPGAPDPGEQVEALRDSRGEDRYQAARARVEEARLWAAGAPPAADEAALGSGLAGASAALAEAEAALAALPEGAPALERELASLEVERARAVRDGWLEWLDAVRRGVVADAGAEVDRAQVEATEARRAAESARRDAQGAEAIRMAELQESWATAQERTTGAWAAVRDSRDAAEAQGRATEEELVAAERQLRLVEQLPFTNPERPEPDALYREAQRLVSALRGRSRDRGRELIRAQRDRDAVAERLDAERAAIEGGRQRFPEGAAEGARATLERWEASLDDEARAGEEALVVAREAQQIALLQLDRAKDLRRAAEPWASRASRAEVSRQWPEELRQEVSLLGPNTAARGRDRVRDVRALPQVFTDMTRVWRLLRATLLLGAFLGAWLLGRRLVPTGVEVILGRARGLLERLGEVDRLRAPLATAFVHTVDLVALLVLLGRIAEALPELALVLLAVVQVSIYRLLLAVFDLVVVPAAEIRPALRVVSKAVYDQARRTVRALLLWVILRQFILFLTLEVLGADTLTRIVRILFFWAGVALVVWLLHRWEPELRGRMAREHQGNRVVGLLSTPPPHPLLAAGWSVADLAFLGARAAVDLSYRVGREGSGLGQLLNLVGRYRMAGSEPTAEVEVRPLSPEVGERILVAGMTMVSRQEVVEELEAHRADWSRESRRGLVALLGDRGEGRRTFLSAYAEHVSGQGAEVTYVELGRRLTTDGQALGWLAEALDLSAAPETPDEAVAAVAALAPRVVIVERGHMAFLRAVGGFGGLRVLLYVLNATADRHFWVVGFHRPAWAYLARLGDLANVEVFRATVALPPLGEKDLRALAVGRTREAGFEPDFTPLSSSRLLGGDPQVELERSTTLYFRLLSETSDGNAAVAMRLWRDCLHPTDEPGVLDVRMGRTMQLGALTGLSDVHLFALAALRTLEVLDEAELVAVTNMAAASMRQAVKHLSARGILDRDEHRVQITYESLPIVTRTLRRRHFIQWI